MSNISVDEIQSEVGAVVDQDEKTADISATDYSLRLKYANMAQREWAEAYDWQVLYKEYNTQTSTSTGNTSIALPLDYRKLASFPRITWDGSKTDSFTEVRRQGLGHYQDSSVVPTQSSDAPKICAIIGNPSLSYTMYTPLITLVSGASIMIPYYSSPQSLASPADLTPCPNPLYMVKRTIAFLWESREDPRYLDMKQEAMTILGKMIDYENVFGEASDFDRVRTTDETRNNFRWGK